MLYAQLDHHRIAYTRSGNRQGETMLLVHGITTYSFIWRKLLTHLGYKAIQAVDGVQALEVYAENKKHIALIMTDMVMPNLGGMKLAKAIWEQQSLLPIIFISGYNESSLTIDASKQRHIAILQKPYSIKKLSQNIRNLLDVI
ncbi:MAG: response regulator [Mariprofundaceae bacterium]